VLLNEIMDEFAGEMVGMGEEQSWCILYPRKTTGNHTDISVASVSGKIQTGYLPNTSHMYIAQLSAV
jgi:hypothetical protein